MSTSRHGWIATALLVAATAFACDSRSSADRSPDADLPRIELRLAQRTPAPGLQRHDLEGVGQIYVADDVVLSGEHFEIAHARPDSTSVDLELHLNAAGRERLGLPTGRNIGRLLTAWVDGTLVGAPTTVTSLSGMLPIYVKVPTSGPAESERIARAVYARRAARPEAPAPRSGSPAPPPPPAVP